MKKFLLLPVFILGFSILFVGCKKEEADPVVRTSGETSVTSQVPVVEQDLGDYPDKLEIVDGDTETVTIFKCGTVYYGCVDGTQSWEEYASAPLDLDDGSFAHAKVDYKLLYGGIVGYVGTKQITSVSDVTELLTDDVLAGNSIMDYDESEGHFSGPRLIEKDGKNYIICRDNLLQYRLYDESGQLLCTCAEYTEAAGFAG